MTSRTAYRDALLLVANYDSSVGYAWWLMESFWVALANRYSTEIDVLLAYPSITNVPPNIAEAPIVLKVADFTTTSVRAVIYQLRLLRENRVRFMYFTDAPSYSLRYAFYRLAGVQRIVVHDHTPGHRDIPSALILAIKKLVHRLRWISADAMIGVTPFVSKRHRDVLGFPSERCFTAENGIPFPSTEDRLDVHSTFGIPASRLVLVAVGRAHHVKGIAVILDAMANLIHKRGVRSVHFLFCGDGPHLGDFREKAIELGVVDYVTFAGRQGSITALLNGCDIAIHASLAEVGYSLSILECMRAGLPVVVTDDESVSGATLPGTTGLLFSASNSSAAADAIEHLVQDAALRSSLGAAAKEHVRKNFTLSRTHHQLLEVFEHIL